jgi:hypothetical protein
VTDKQSAKPFMRALSEVLRDRGHPAVLEDGNINWSVFARDLPEMHYETLRKIRAGDRVLDKDAVEQIAKAAGVEPAYFAEYRMMLAREQFDPRIVGFEQAVKSLEGWLGDPGPGRLRNGPAAPPRAASA